MHGSIFWQVDIRRAALERSWSRKQRGNSTGPQTQRQQLDSSNSAASLYNEEKGHAGCTARWRTRTAGGRCGPGYWQACCGCDMCLHTKRDAAVPEYQQETRRRRCLRRGLRGQTSLWKTSCPRAQRWGVPDLSVYRCMRVVCSSVKNYIAVYSTNYTEPRIQKIKQPREGHHMGDRQGSAVW